MTAPQAATLNRNRSQAEHLADRLPPLLIDAERVAATVAQGVHGRRRTGIGETFWQFRPYYQGDDTTRIDWRQTAKGTHTFVREQEWEAAESAWLWADRSGSMRYASHLTDIDKHDRALVLLLALAALLSRAGERIALLDSARRPMSGKAALDGLQQALLETASAPEDAVPLVNLPRFARLVLLSDFLTPLDVLHKRLRAYVGMGVRGVLLQVLDPAELNLPFAGRMLFEDTEGLNDHALIRQVEAVRPEYRQRFEAHQASLRDLGRRLGWPVLVHRTDRPAEQALLSLYTALAQPAR